MEHLTPPLTGDEPHYAVIATAVGRDHTLDLRRAYADPTGVARLSPGLTTTGQAAVYRTNGPVASVHTIGLGVLLAPVAKLHLTVNGLRWVMVIFSALLAWQLADLLRELFPDHQAAAWLAWAGTCFTMPLAVFSNQLYPEVPAALLLVLGARFVRRRADLCAGLCAAALPWLHVRFGWLAIALLVWAMWTTRRATAAVPFAVSLVGLAACFLYLYGSPFPWAPYRASVVAIPHQGWTQTYGVGLGTWLSPTSGVLPFGPFAAVGVVGIGPAVRRFGPAAAVVAGVHALVVVPLGPFAYNLPGRYAVVLLPFLAIAAACLLTQWRAARVMAAGLVAVSVAVIVSHATPAPYGSLYDQGVVRALNRTAFLWPVTAAAGGVDRFEFAANSGYQQRGTLSPDGRTLTVSAGGPPETVYVSPIVTLRPARYVMHVDATGDATTTVTIIDSARHPLVSATLRPGVPVMFTSKSVVVVNVTVEVSGRGAANLRGIDGEVVGQATPRTAPLARQVWKGLLWVAVLAALAVAGFKKSAAQEPQASLVIGPDLDKSGPSTTRYGG